MLYRLPFTNYRLFKKARAHSAVLLRPNRVKAKKVLSFYPREIAKSKNITS